MYKLVNDLAGETFGKLTVLEFAGTKNRKASWSCECDCGNHVVRTAEALRAGKTSSCGCNAIKHGMNGTKEYNAWRQMQQRCYNENTPHYDRYGGRGITVCDAWRENFDTFLADVGMAPSPMHSLDRENNDLPYQPGNVRWATKKQQSRNTSTNRMVTVNGETMALAEAVERFSPVSYRAVKTRLSKGWSEERAVLERPLR